MREAIRHLTAADPVLSRIIERVGPYRMQFREPNFDTLVRSIVYQQLSGKVAKVIFDRLAMAAVAGASLTPDGVLKLRPTRMRALGLSRQKTAYIRDLARLTRNGQVAFESLPGLSDQQVIDQLTQVKGIGVWTAHMFLMFALRRLDVLPVGDLGIRVAVRKAYGLDETPRPADVAALGERWRPYATVASWYLWRSLETDANL
ncbi:MAG TPA: DNA-3-methyladenine glycosylase 2 family protein [Bryobacteraceae bacterium]|nr:DNA-3-methyladenine glycosylase 2 family protein [Bryobacteraceae bacterium]